MTAFLSVSDVSMAFPVKGNGRFLALDRTPWMCEERVRLPDGHSGCAKSTCLNLIAGLLLRAQGHHLRAEADRGTGTRSRMVFQSHALLPG